MKKGLLIAICSLLPFITAVAGDIDRSGEWFSQSTGEVDMAATRSDRGGMLGVGCQNGMLVIAVHSETPLFNARGMNGIDHPISAVSFKVDDDEAKSLLGLLQHGDKVFMTNGAVGTDFNYLLRSLRSGRTVAVEMILATQTQSKHYFSLRGSSTAINNVVEQCN